MRGKKIKLNNKEVQIMKQENQRTYCLNTNARKCLEVAEQCGYAKDSTRMALGYMAEMAVEDVLRSDYWYPKKPYHFEHDDWSKPDLWEYGFNLGIKKLSNDGLIWVNFELEANEPQIIVKLECIKRGSTLADAVFTPKFFLCYPSDIITADKIYTDGKRTAIRLKNMYPINLSNGQNLTDLLIEKLSDYCTGSEL